MPGLAPEASGPSKYESRLSFTSIKHLPIFVWRSNVFITEAPGRGGVGNPRGLTVSVDLGHAASQVSPGVDTYVMHVMHYVMHYVMRSPGAVSPDPGPTRGRPLTR